MIVTKHAKSRIKQRLGLPKRAHRSHIHKVLSKGKLYSRQKQEQFKIHYNHYLYIFRLTKKLEPVLITTFSMKIA